MKWALTSVLVQAVVVAGAGVTSADTKPALAPLEGATEAARFSSEAGFVDDAITGDATRMAYVVSDGSTTAQLHVVTLADKSERVVDLASVTTHPVVLDLVGPRIFVIGVLDDGDQVAALVELTDVSKAKPAGTVVYKIPAATHITIVTRDGKERIAVHHASASNGGTKHEVDLLALDTGQRISAGHALELDADNASAKLQFKVNHWYDGMTHAYGIKGSESTKMSDAHPPDAEASYDLITGKFETHVISDLFEQHKRFQTLADASAGIDFVRMTWDDSVIQLWSAGKSHDIALDQPLPSYDPKSLQGIVAADGSAWISLKIDPVNREAVARKKADPEYLDIFHVAADGKATRKVRVLSTGTRYRFGLIGSKLWLLERNKGFERGGKSLALYSIP